MSATNEKHTCTGWKGSLGCSACNRGVPAPTRRLIGWRVRYEWWSHITHRWAVKRSGVYGLLRAQSDAASLRMRSDTECRDVRVLRVYRRSKL